MKIPIMQSREWQKLQSDLNETSFLKQGENFQYLAILNKTPVGNYLYCPYGPVAENKVSFNRSIKSLKELAKEQQAFFIRIEPFTDNLLSASTKNLKKTTDLNPKETWLLDLTGENIQENLPSRLVRYHKNAAKNNLTIEKSHNKEDIKYLIKLQNDLASKKGISTFSENYLKTEASQPFSTIYLVKYQSPDAKITEVVAAGLVFDDKDTRYNLQGAQSEQGRALHATGILTIQLILDAKEKNLKTFDFWGITPENAPKNHPWAGFTNFKKTFKGSQFNHAGTYDLVLDSKKYTFYKVLRKINRLIRKF